jgi:hypothetical protein
MSCSLPTHNRSRHDADAYHHCKHVQNIKQIIVKVAVLKHVPD